MRALGIGGCLLALTALAACQSDGGVARIGAGQVVAPTSIRQCPRAPKAGQAASVVGTIARLDKGGTMALIFVENCRVMVVAEGDVRGCRRGGHVSARGRVQLYDLYPTMESFFIQAKAIACS